MMVRISEFISIYDLLKFRQSKISRKRDVIKLSNSSFLYHLLSFIPLATSESLYDTFSSCLSLHTPPFTNISQLLYTPASLSYFSLLQSTIQNLRFTSPTIPKPLLIITPSHQSHVQASVICCKNHSLAIRIRSGGHDYEGLSYRSTTNNTQFAIIDLANLRRLTVNIETSTAWVEAGATLGELYYNIAKISRTHGFPAGVCSTVCVGGQLSGGGSGTMQRKFGLAADNILDAKLVDVKGRILDRESMGEDLFWAIRGGGGASFGVIVSWKVKLVQVPSIITVFRIRKTLNEGAIELVNKWQYIAPNLPEDLYLRVDITRGERGVEAVFSSYFFGGCSELVQILNESFPELDMVRSDCREKSWIDSIMYFSGFEEGEPIDILLDRGLQQKAFAKGKSDIMKYPISEIGWKKIWNKFSEDGAGSMNIDPLGGRMSQILESETPFPYRKGNLFIIQYLVRWEENGVEASEKHLSWIRRLYEEMGPYVSKNPRGSYLNYRDLDLGSNEEEGGRTSYLKAEVWGRKYFGSNFIKLAKVKGEVDPENFFRNEQSIPPLFAGNSLQGISNTRSQAME